MKINRTTQRTVSILKLVSASQSGITLDEICDQLEIPKTSAYDIITTLVYLGMVNLTRGQKQKYTIGLSAYRIGMNYTNNLDFISVIEPQLKEFTKEMGKTVFFGIPSEHEIVYISKFEPENPIITTATVGTKNPMYCTSLGKAMLAYLPPEEQDRIIKRTKFRERTSYTITNEADLRKELAKVREKGYSVDYRELEEHMVCLGAPVFDRDGHILGAISVSGLYRGHENYEQSGELVRQRAGEVSRLLGFLD